MTEAKAPKAVVDWDALEPHYRAGQRSLKALGAEFGVSDAGIVKHARKNGWTRNLQAKIDAKTREKVSAAVVSAEVSEGQKLTEQVRVEVEAQVRARLELAQRSDSAELRTASMALVREIGSVAENATDLGKLAEIIESGDEGKMRDAVQRVVSLPGRVKAFKDAADTAIKAVELERRVNRMDEGGSGGASDFERMLSEIHGAVT